MKVEDFWHYDDNTKNSEMVGNLRENDLGELGTFAVGRVRERVKGKGQQSNSDDRLVPICVHPQRLRRHRKNASKSLREKRSVQVRTPESPPRQAFTISTKSRDDCDVFARNDERAGDGMGERLCRNRAGRLWKDFVFMAFEKFMFFTF